jgi:hypothetical protein
MFDFYCFCGYNNNMAKIISMTSEEIKKNYNLKKVVAMAKSAPEEKKLPFNTGQAVGRGFASLKEHINKSDCPLKENKKKHINHRTNISSNQRSIAGIAADDKFSVFVQESQG